MMKNEIGYLSSYILYIKFFFCLAFKAFWPNRDSMIAIVVVVDQGSISLHINGPRE